jgi:hypothetical protein
MDDRPTGGQPSDGAPTCRSQVMARRLGHKQLVLPVLHNIELGEFCEESHGAALRGRRG